MHDRTFSAVLARTRFAQKTAKGAPAYSRFINRSLGRYLASAAYLLGLTPNAVTMISAGFSGAAILGIALCRPTIALALLVTAGLVLGYAFDSADGQLARLRGGGSPAGEWLDHMIDCVKVTSLHVAVLISLYRFDTPTTHAWLLLPLGFVIVAVTFFFGTILTDQLRRAHWVKIGRPPADVVAEPAPVLRSLVVLPTDYGMTCLCFLFFDSRTAFLIVYAALLAGTLIFLAAVLAKWYREILAFPSVAVG